MLSVAKRLGLLYDTTRWVAEQPKDTTRSTHSVTQAACFHFTRLHAYARSRVLCMLSGSFVFLEPVIEQCQINILWIFQLCGRTKRMRSNTSKMLWIESPIFLELIQSLAYSHTKSIQDAVHWLTVKWFGLTQFKFRRRFCRKNTQPHTEAICVLHDFDTLFIPFVSALLLPSKGEQPPFDDVRDWWMIFNMKCVYLTSSARSEHPSSTPSSHNDTYYTFRFGARKQLS